MTTDLIESLLQSLPESHRTTSDDDLFLDREAPTIALGTIGELFTEAVDAGLDRDRIAAFLHRVEAVMTDGNDYEKDVMATGLLEALVHRADEGFDFSLIDPYLGPESRAYCHAYNEFTGVPTPGLS